jgi:hypothetical protein
MKLPNAFAPSLTNLSVLPGQEIQTIEVSCLLYLKTAERNCLHFYLVIDTLRGQSKAAIRVPTEVDTKVFQDVTLDFFLNSSKMTSIPLLEK